MIKFIRSAVFRTVISAVLLCIALICNNFKQAAPFALPLFIVAAVLCLFPTEKITFKAKKVSVPFTCDKCGEEETVLIMLRHDFVCALLPFIRIPFCAEYFKGCAGCYQKEKDDRTNAELMLLTRTGIIKNEKITRKEYKEMKKDRCN